MHMISKKDLNSAELETVTTSKKSYDCHNRQWRSADAMKRPQCTSKTWIYY